MMQNRGAGRPHPALRATLSRWERKTLFTLSFLLLLLKFHDKGLT
jgi:hypothetical protein